MLSLRSVLSAALAALFALAATAGAARAQGKGKGEDERDRPHDLILAVDVSLSMIMPTRGQGKVLPPNDREGLRWDGIQFTVDVYIAFTSTASNKSA